MKDRAYRRSVLRKFGARSSTIEELLEYNTNVFDRGALGTVLGDEPFVATWKRYMRESGLRGTYVCLQDRLLQLQFPLEKGISADPAYIAATRRGRPPSARSGLELNDPKGVRIEMQATAAGQIPLIITPDRSDFVALTCALSRKNEPCDIPASMGACLVAGFNNWDRVQQYRAEWERQQPHQIWADEFRRFAAQKHLYQDSFVIMSEGLYSGVTPEDLGLTEDVWRASSQTIRREHECTHYYTRRVLGSMQNNILDELIADYIGIVVAAGQFRSDWFLRFMGLELYPEYRSGGRFENYVGNLSRPAIETLALLVVHSTENLERHFRHSYDIPFSTSEKARVVGILASLTIEEMASGDFASNIQSSG